MAPVSVSAVVAEIKAHSERHYVYVLHRPCGAPFYVGVGTGRRVTHHERNAASAKQSAKYEAIRQIVGAGGAVAYSIAGWFECWQDAASEERRLIGLHGRADLGNGVLCNRTNGGQGLAGARWVLTEARKAGVAKAAEKNRGRKPTAETRAKIGMAQKGRPKGENFKLACCRFRGHRDKVFNGTGELECDEGSSAASSSLRR